MTTFSLVAVASKIAEMTRAELCHAMASHSLDVEIYAYDNAKHIRDIDLIATGFPRTHDVNRRELPTKNAQTTKETVESTVNNNPKA